MNEKGQSWPEAMLSLLIIMVIFSSLLPLATKLTTTVVAKKQSMVAAQTSYQAAIHYRARNQTSGVRTHEQLEYHWVVKMEEICVTYEGLQGFTSKCVNL
ncbi:hypothetical protein DV702_04290 [Sporosarcina sp. PTS2304]|uniref:hypothetical protein n=1 Tax=Sporosarcina sp. PTS2304 TaxID=2283194 RepID=UPI000E0CBFF5|nr:hypothetical protein [Sporosarcina sp. PTS2304]AXH99019.1 hypothetical protein DV702_04290 [Sporosarcina sp. PTS2304]